MSTAKDNILQRLRAAKHKPAHQTLPSWQPPCFEKEERLLQFKKSLIIAHAEIIETTEETWAQELINIATSKHLTQWLYSPDTTSGLAFDRAVESQAGEIKVTSYNKPVETFKSQLFHEIEASFTEVKAGIADTGTLVIVPDKSEPRLMSLVPPVHVALFRESTLLNNFSELIEQENWSTTGLPSNALLVSGPSKTADIQQTLAYGAHGPKELIILIITDRATCNSHQNKAPTQK